MSDDGVCVRPPCPSSKSEAAEDEEEELEAVEDARSREGTETPLELEDEGAAGSG